MATRVEMPKPGNTVEECLLAKWLKSAGSAVQSGEVIAEIETDKATFEVPAPASGVLLVTFFGEGALVPVFSTIAVIGEAGEDTSAFAPSATVAPIAETPSIAATPAPLQEPAPAPSTTSFFISPRARRFAAEHSVALGDIHGSGPGGRILEQDVRDRYHSAPRRSSAAAGAPLGRMREKIAARMRDSLQQTAQYTLTASANAGPLLALRARIKAARFTPDVNINELVLYCTVRALLKMPALNAELRDGQLILHHRVHLGFACDTERGLLVPVVRDAHLMDVSALATAVKSLAESAVSGAISPDDLSGATFTVSNLGSLGIESFTPILNPPQVGILGVNSIRLQPIRTLQGIEMTDRIGLSLTCDHQVIDGAPGARFLAIVRECIEGVQSLCGLEL